jgi:putative acetyltransferase
MTSPSIVIRPYQPGDAQATFRTFVQAVRETASTHYSAEQRAAWAPDDLDPAAWADRRTNARTVVAVLDGGVVGFSDLDESGYVDMLFVHPSAGRRGVGAALLEAILNQAQQEGLTRLTTNASKTARPVFERAGFEVEVEQRVSRNGVELTNYRMVRHRRI